MYPDDFDSFTKPAPGTIRSNTGGVSPAVLVAALADRVEKLEQLLGLLPSVEFTANAATDTCTSVGHGMSEGAAFTVKSTGGVVPSPLQEGVIYYGQSVNPDDFQITATQFSGVPIDLTDNGTGTLTFTPYHDLGKILMSSASANTSRWSNQVDLTSGTLVLPNVSSASPRDIPGDIIYDSATDEVKWNAGSSVTKTVVDLDSAQTLDQKTLLAPNIADFTNAQHDHTSASEGGELPIEAINNPYVFSARRTTAHTPSANSRIQYATVDIDPNSNFDSTTNVGRYTVPVSGYYQINAISSMSMTAAPQDPQITLMKNGATGIGYGHMVNMYNGATAESVYLSVVVDLTAGDYIEVWIGTSYALHITGGSNVFSGFLVHAT